MRQRKNTNLLLLLMGGLFLILSAAFGVCGIWWGTAIAIVASVPGLYLGISGIRREQRSKARMQRSIRRKLKQNHGRAERLTSAQRHKESGYGLKPENPVIMGNGIDLPRYGLHAQGIRRWLDDLRAEDGRPLSYQKVGTQVLPELYGQREVTVDAYAFYDLSLPGRSVYATVYVSPEGLDTYLPDPPKGFASSGRNRGNTHGDIRTAAVKPYYAMLGVNSDASGEEIKMAYRALAKKYHPDVAGDDPAAAEKMKQLNLAYATLSDPELRQKYDSGRK